MLKRLLALFLLLLPLAAKAQTAGWEFPTGASYTASSSDNGKILASDDVPGTSITVQLPSASVVGAGWEMGFSNGGGHGVIVNAPSGQYVLAGQKTMTSISSPSNTNSEFFVLQSDGANYRLLSATAKTVAFNGVAPAAPSGFNFLFATGYGASLGDGGAVLSSALAGGTVTLTLPSAPLLPNGWTIALNALANPFAIELNGVQGGTLLSPLGSSVASYTTVSNGYYTIQFDGGSFHIFLITSQALPHVASNTALQALKTTDVPDGVWRDDFAAGFGAQRMFYKPQAAACGLNGGNGDNGSEVKSTDGGCFIWQPKGLLVSPATFGADPTGTAESSAAVEAAGAAMADGVLSILPNELYKINAVTFGELLTIIGPDGPEWSQQLCRAGCLANAANLNLLLIAHNGGGYEKLCVEMAAAAGTNTSGAAILLGGNGSGQYSWQFARRVHVVNACVGVDISGNTSVLSEAEIDNVAGSGCDPIRIGQYTTAKGTIDPFVEKTNATCLYADQGDASVKIEDAGGFTLGIGNNFQFCKYGTWIDPGASQDVAGKTFGMLGDTVGTSPLEINTAASSGTVEAIDFDHVWASGNGNTGPGIEVDNAGGGTIGALHFNGGDVLLNGTVGMLLNAGTDTQIDGVAVCANSQTAAGGNDGIHISANVSGGRIENTRSSGACDGFSNNQATNLWLNGGGNANWTIIGNDVEGAATTGEAGSPTGNSVMALNRGIDDETPSIASASSITLPANPVVGITGTTTISTMTAGWNNRKVTILPVGALPFTTGGNICNALTATANVPVEAVWNAGNNCWALK